MNFFVLYFNMFKNTDNEHKKTNSRPRCNNRSKSSFLFVCFLLLKLMKCSLWQHLWFVSLRIGNTNYVYVRYNNMVVNGECWCDFSNHRIWPELMEKVFILYFLNLHFVGETKRKCTTKILLRVAETRFFVRDRTNGFSLIGIWNTDTDWFFGIDAFEMVWKINDDADTKW